jgi:hypothetical protein
MNLSSKIKPTGISERLAAGSPAAASLIATLRLCEASLGYLIGSRSVNFLSKPLGRGKWLGMIACELFIHNPVRYGVVETFLRSASSTQAFPRPLALRAFAWFPFSADHVESICRMSGAAMP